STQVVRQEPSLQTFLQTRSALAGTVSNVLVVKTAIAVPIKVIERMFGLLWPQTTGQDRLKFLRTLSIQTTIFAVSHGTLFITLATPTDPSVSKDIFATANFAAAKIWAPGP